MFGDKMFLKYTVISRYEETEWSRVLSNFPLTLINILACMDVGEQGGSDWLRECSFEFLKYSFPANALTQHQLLWVESVKMSKRKFLSAGASKVLIYS